VVVENITRFLREGHPRREAAILATRQIATAVLGCTATLLFAFVPLLFLPGNAGDFIRSLPMSVLLTVLGSLAVALTIIPFLGSLVLSGRGHERGNVFLRLLVGGIERTFRPLLRLALRFKLLTLLVSVAGVAASVALVPRIGFSLFPTAGLRQFRVTVETPEGASIEATDAAVRRVEAVLAGVPELTWTMANVGKRNPQVFYNVLSEAEAANTGEVLAELRAWDPDRSPALLEDLRRRLDGWPEARVQVKEFENGIPIAAPIEIRLLGDDLDDLARAAAQVERLLQDTAGTMYVENPYKLQRTDLVAEVDRDRAGMLGVPTIQIARMVRLAVGGLTLGTLRTEDGREHDVALVLPTGHNRLDGLDLLEIPTVTGGTARFADVAALGFERSPASIHHYGAKQRCVTVTAAAQAGWNVDRLTRGILARLAEVELPPGVRWQAAGEVESREESFGGLGAAILVAVFMILAILVLEFRTFRGTLVVASVIPLGVMGGLLALYWTGYTLSFTAVVGFTALIGIEIKTSILLVDFTNQLRAAGVPLVAAVQRAGEIRFLPILLTTLTAIGGLIPLALQESSLYSPLAWVIIGGLTSSTLLARIVTPVLYVLLAPKDAPPPPATPPGPQERSEFLELAQGETGSQSL